MASAPRRTFSSRSRRGKADAFMPSPVRATKPRKILPVRSALSGPAVLTSGRRKRSMPQSSSRPSGGLVPAALAAVKKGGRVVCGGIHMSDIPSFPYRLLWQERQLVSVANLTRKDGYEFLGIAPRAGIKMQVTRYPLAQANTALNDLRAGHFEGAAVLIP